MMDNPLQPDENRDARIRERAYHLWEQDGCPHGRHHEYWERASELVGMEDSAGAGQLPNPQTHPARNEVAPGVLVEEAAIQENLGEFPGRFTDQGEHPPPPEPRHSQNHPAPGVENQPPMPEPIPELPDKPDTVEYPLPDAGAASAPPGKSPKKATGKKASAKKKS